MTATFTELIQQLVSNSFIERRASWQAHFITHLLEQTEINRISAMQFFRSKILTDYSHGLLFFHYTLSSYHMHGPCVHPCTMIC